jgi:hypothetical protein
MAEYIEIITNSQTGEVTHRPFTDAEIAALQPTDAELAAEVRAQRNSLLAASDWTQVIDTPVNIVTWGAYRKALRDITAQPGFPANVIWPSKPE